MCVLGGEELVVRPEDWKVNAALGFELLVELTKSGRYAK